MHNRAKTEATAAQAAPKNNASKRNRSRQAKHMLSSSCRTPPMKNKMAITSSQRQPCKSKPPHNVAARDGDGQIAEGRQLLNDFILESPRAPHHRSDEPIRPTFRYTLKPRWETTLACTRRCADSHKDTATRAVSPTLQWENEEGYDRCEMPTPKRLPALRMKQRRLSPGFLLETTGSTQQEQLVNRFEQMGTVDSPSVLSIPTLSPSTPTLTTPISDLKRRLNPTLPGNGRIVDIIQTDIAPPEGIMLPVL